jgi:hypothetical protein
MHQVPALVLLRAAQRGRVGQPGGQLDRPAVGREHGNDRGIVEHGDDLTGARQAAEHGTLEVARRPVVVVRAHQQRPGGQIVPGEPAFGEAAGAVGTSGQVDDVVVDDRIPQPLRAFLQQRVTPCGLDEALPPLRTTLDVVRPVPHVGEHTVDVEDGKWPRVG